MISAPVGWQCPACLKGAPAVRRMRDIQGGGIGRGGEKPYLTYGLIAACVVAFFAQQGSTIDSRFDIVASAVARGQWYRVVTSGFLHAGLIHLVFNMAVLFQLGSILEGRLGRTRLAALYALSLVGGSIGVMLLQPPNQPALGASGAVFGLMGAVVVLPRRGARSPLESGVGGLLLINLVITFVLPGIAIGGHLGGLAAGGVGGLVIRALGERVDLRRLAVTTVVLVAFTGGLFLAARPVAEWRCSSASTSTSSDYQDGGGAC